MFFNVLFQPPLKVEKTVLLAVSGLSFLVLTGWAFFPSGVIFFVFHPFLFPLGYGPVSPLFRTPLGRVLLMLLPFFSFPPIPLRDPLF